MGITHEDFQKARRISRAIQEYLETTHQQGIRSTDIYPYLAKKGLIQKDRYNGFFLRQFLNKLKKYNLLHLIPQCTCSPSFDSEFSEWYFYKADPDLHERKIDDEFTRQNYPRAYEYWTDREIEIMKRAYNKFKRIDKVADLLERQPNVIET